MLYTITVSFGETCEYEFKFLDSDIAGLPRDQARAWLHREFEALECTPRNPVGKILLLDVILDVAKYGGEKRFAAGKTASALAFDPRRKLIELGFSRAPSQALHGV